MVYVTTMPHYISLVLPCVPDADQTVKIKVPFDGHEFLLEPRNDRRYRWDTRHSQLYDTYTAQHREVVVQAINEK